MISVLKRYYEKTGTTKNTVVKYFYPDAKWVELWKGLDGVSGNGVTNVYKKNGAFIGEIKDGKLSQTASHSIHSYADALNMESTTTSVGNTSLYSRLILKNNQYEKDMVFANAHFIGGSINGRISLFGCMLDGLDWNGTVVSHRLTSIKAGIRVKNFVGMDTAFSFAEGGRIKADSVFLTYSENYRDTFPNFATLFEGSKSVVVAFNSEIKAEACIGINNAGGASLTITGLSDKYPLIVVFGQSDLTNFTDFLNNETAKEIGLTVNNEEAFKRLAKFTKLVKTKPSKNPPVLDLSKA